MIHWMHGENHDVVHDVREMIVSTAFIISAGYAFSHYYKKKEGWKYKLVKCTMLHLYFMSCFKSSDVSM